MEEDRYCDVLLTYPAENLRIFEPMIPLGIASLAAVLEEHNFFVKIVDFNRYKGDYRRDLKRWNPKIIGIGGTTPTRKGSFLTAELSKKVLPDVPVVYGGVHATFTAKDTLDNVPQIDFIVKGEGEYTFLALCKKFIRNNDVDLFELDGLCFRHRGEIIENSQARIHNLDYIPMPSRHLFDYDYNMTLDCNNLKADFIMTSRGCPASCSFCSASRMFPGGVRFRSMPEIQKEIEFILWRQDIKALKIFDSTFTADREHVVNFCNMIRQYDLLWECEIRADTVDKGLLQQMKEAGCCSINVGMETTHERLLKQIGKNIRVQQVESVLAWCRDLDINTKVFFTFGHLDETYSECVQDIDYIKEKKDDIDFYATTVGIRVYPGTTLEKQMQRKSLMPKNFSWARFKSPMKNLLLMETSDVLLLEQKKLTFFKLSTLIVRLCTQGTVLSANYIWKMLRNNVAGLIESAFTGIRNTRHRVERVFIKIDP